MKTQGTTIRTGQACSAIRSYLDTLCRDTGEEFDGTLSKADASKRIDELRERSPRLTQE